MFMLKKPNTEEKTEKNNSNKTSQYGDEFEGFVMF